MEGGRNKGIKQGRMEEEERDELGSELMIMKHMEGVRKEGGREELGTDKRRELGRAGERDGGKKEGKEGGSRPS